MCAGGRGSISGAEKLVYGFHPSGVGKIRSNLYVVGWLQQKTAELKTAAVRWSRAAYAASGTLPHTTSRVSLAVSRIALELTWNIYSALEMFVFNFFSTYGGLGPVLCHRSMVKGAKDLSNFAIVLSPTRKGQYSTWRVPFGTYLRFSTPRQQAELVYRHPRHHCPVAVLNTRI